MTDNPYHLPVLPATAISRAWMNQFSESIHSRLLSREALEATFELLQTQGVQAALDYVQVTIAPVLADLQAQVVAAQEAIEGILLEGASPNSLMLGGKLPEFFATASSVSSLSDDLDGAVDAINTSLTQLTSTLESYGSAVERNITVSADQPVGGVTGDIWILI